MTIQIDSREKAKAIEKIIGEFNHRDIKHFSSKLPVGDYMNLENPMIVVDRKQNLSEVYSNLCQDHKRFVSELLRAKEIGIKVIVLVEHGGFIKLLEDVKTWKNPRLAKSPYAWNGERMYNVMRTVSQKYNTEFMFCKKSETGSKIIELLEKT